MVFLGEYPSLCVRSMHAVQTLSHWGIPHNDPRALVRGEGGGGGAQGGRPPPPPTSPPGRWRCTGPVQGLRPGPWEGSAVVWRGGGGSLGALPHRALRSRDGIRGSTARGQCLHVPAAVDPWGPVRYNGAGPAQTRGSLSAQAPPPPPTPPRQTPPMDSEGAFGCPWSTARGNVSGTAAPRSSQTGQVIRGLR